MVESPGLRLIPLPPASLGGGTYSEDLRSLAYLSFTLTAATRPDGDRGSVGSKQELFPTSE